MHVSITSQAHEKTAPFASFPTQIDHIYQHKGDSVISPQLVSAGNSIPTSMKILKSTNIYACLFLGEQIVKEIFKRNCEDCFFSDFKCWDSLACLL